MSTLYRGVFTAITTPFNADLSVDHGFLAEHAAWQLANGCVGTIPCGSLGESATLSFEEKLAVIGSCVRASGNKPVVPGIASLSTAEAVRLAQGAADLGAKGLMILPPYVYASDWREMKAHMSAVLEATALPCIIYNNPVAYKTDFLPEQILELAAEHENAVAVKESSTDARRVTALKALAGDSLALGVGVDDCLVEGVAAGASFWVAGQVNAFPAESVKLYELAMAGRWAEAAELYRWFLPLLRLDTVLKFVQLIKLTQERVGMGSARVRPPRLELAGAELEAALAVIDKGIRERPVL
ncbi:MAG: dihydrodipicolinate synthase family protein [Gammaproteobacteria bacterium]|nr:dihydrodipicolinate synthase family protein [Gammaproteobacteria bacterium]